MADEWVKRSRRRRIKLVRSRVKPYINFGLAGRREKLSTVDILIPLHGFPRWPDHFFLVNRVENQTEPNRTQTATEWWRCGFSTRPTAMGGTDYNLHIVLSEHLNDFSAWCSL